MTPSAGRSAELKKVSVIGLGPMGSALAKALAEAGFEVTVWNRTRLRVEPLVAIGASAAESPAEAVAKSPLTIINVKGNEAVAEILAGGGMADVLGGRVIADLSSGTPPASRELADLVRAAGGTYLGGGIMSYPRSIGEDETVILYSGDRGAFEANADLLATLAGSQRFVGDGDGDAVGLYLACWNFYFGGLGGWLEAAAYAAALNVDVLELRQMTPVMIEQLAIGTEDAHRRIESGSYEGDKSSVDSHVVGLSASVRNLRQEGVEAHILPAFIDQCRSAAAAGFGGRDIATIFEAIGARPGVVPRIPKAD